MDVARETHEKDRGIWGQAQAARRTLAPLERRFQKDARKRWPRVTWRRYHPVTIAVHFEQKSTWYAPFLCIEKKVIVVLEDRTVFPYRVYGQNHDLYARYGYTVLDFSEDFSCPTDDSVWEEVMARVALAVR